MFFHSEPLSVIRQVVFSYLAFFIIAKNRKFVNILLPIIFVILPNSFKARYRHRFRGYNVIKRE